MIKFDNYAILDEHVHHFEKYPEWHWKIKPVTAGVELEMSKFMAHNRAMLGPDGQRREYPPTSMEIAFREIALTFGGSNIPKEQDKPVEEGGEALIPADAPVEQIEATLKLFPRSMLMEIWRAVGEAYPFWGPSDPNAR